ncbi:hypothetical protein niasHT_005449 [Heterodera trifolii]|uniref:SH2 domain-containing protein n=1 Tax=Heterodera trifolii TaxID=157864 RepID=A0ABD2M5E3_9BILA
MDSLPIDSKCLRETEKELQKSGITFYIRFVGFVVVEKSLNSLPIERQTEVTRDFIRLVVDEAGPSRAELAPIGPSGDGICSYLRGPVRVQNADVMLNVSTRNILLIDASSSRVLHRFLIPDVSVLSLGSEAEMASFFCFVAKVSEKGERVRKCFVFMANDRSVLLEVRDAICFTFRLSANANIAREEAKTPVPSSTPPTPICTDLCSQNLAFDFPEPPNELEIRPFPSLVPPEVPPRPKRTARLSSDAGRGPSLSRFREVTFGLEKCRWFHGTMAREEAELFVRENGHFLVRKSPNNDEFILVGMNDGERRHVYLMDNEGKILTTVGEFKNIVALIDYFHGKRKPLVLEDVELMLLKPINRIA